jgi:signal transduction histidine kinase
MSAAPVRVLLVEDNRAEARLFVDMLAQAPALHCEVTHVDRLAPALARLDARPFDIILLDLSLPDSRGLETFQTIRLRAPETPIIVLTGFDDDATALAAVKGGAQDYLAKDHADRYTFVRAVRYALERKQAEQAELERRTLQKTVRSMEQVLAVVAHELRNPLTAMQLIAEHLIAEPDAPAAEQEQFLRSLQDHVGQMTDMVNDLLEAARLESGAARWNWATVRLSDVLREAMESVGPVATTGRVRIDVSLQPEDLVVRGDAGALRRLLVNLVSNALKHTSEGVIEVVARGAPRGKRAVRIIVRDTGAGMTEDVAAQLGVAFALNTGVAGGRETRGAGLGLAICKGIVAAHGGAMSVVSAPGQGTTFTVDLSGDLPGPAPVSDAVRIFRVMAA